MQNNLYDYDILCAIDVGLTGAIAFFDVGSTELLSVTQMPTTLSTKKTKSGKDKYELDIEKLRFAMDIPRNHGDTCLVVIEDVHAFPGQGVVSVGTLLEQKGVIRGIASAFGYSLEMVSPKTWQAHFQILPPKDMKNKVKRKAWLKDKSREVATSNFPEFSQSFSKLSDHGKSDAVLIGAWALEELCT